MPLPPPEGSNVVLLSDVETTLPYMRADAAERYNKLRQIVIKGAGFDFLAVCGDVMRFPDFISTKDGVANRSRHKAADVFDYDQASARLVLVKESKGGKQYFRTYLTCVKQDGTQGKKLDVWDKRGWRVFSYLFDFTAAAESFGFERIPAWNGWEKHYNRQEFWHYQFTNGLTWSQAMAATYPTPGAAAKPAVYGKNDRGFVVKRIQQALADLGLLPLDEVDSVFGAKTDAAVRAFQTKNGLTADGLVGAQTLTALGF